MAKTANKKGGKKPGKSGKPTRVHRMTKPKLKSATNKK